MNCVNTTLHTFGCSLFIPTYMHYTDGLETTRLRTRFLTEADVPAWMEYCNDPIATRFTNLDNKLPSEMAQAWIDRQLNRYRTNKLGVQALIDKESGKFIGMAGLIVQEINGEELIEVGYHLLGKYWGNGYATEAAQKFRDYAFENNMADSVVSIIHPLNDLSKKVALRNGMTLAETNAVFRDNEYNLFRITRPEWEQLRISEKR